MRCMKCGRDLEDGDVFCRECRKLLADQDGYVLADLYVHGEPVVIPITEGMEQELRCYRITAGMNDEGDTYGLKVVGTYGDTNVAK